MQRTAYSHEELRSMFPDAQSKIQKILDETEAEMDGEIKPLPPMTKQECLDYLWKLMDIASEGPLNKSQCFMVGQLFSQFEMAVIAESLGKKGRFYVIPEDKIKELMG